MTEPSPGRRVIEVHRSVIGPAEPRSRNVRPRKLSDYGHVPAVYRDLARKYSSTLMMGPPVCDELMALLQHVFTEEEAGAVRHLGLVVGRGAEHVARKEHRPVDQVAAVLHRLAYEKRVITCSGRNDRTRYRVLPIMPGMFEMALIAHSPETLTDWHRRFIELFEALYETGFAADYAGSVASAVRVLPVGRVIEAHPAALPADQLAAVLDRFDTFAVGQCQCRTTAATLGQGCGRPLGNCMVMGLWARHGIAEGWLRAVGKSEALEIKREAEAQGMVNWIMNVESTKGQCSCSCCGCCCHALRMINEFNAPSLFAPPHFQPRIDPLKCSYCGRCASNCPMAAIRVDSQAKTHEHRKERCVGCGLCALACERQRAIDMHPVPDYKLPYKSWFRLISGTAPGMLGKAWSVWRERGRTR